MEYQVKTQPSLNSEGKGKTKFAVTAVIQYGHKTH